MHTSVLCNMRVKLMATLLLAHSFVTCLLALGPGVWWHYVFREAPPMALPGAFVNNYLVLFGLSLQQVKSPPSIAMKIVRALELIVYNYLGSFFSFSCGLLQAGDGWGGRERMVEVVLSALEPLKFLVLCCVVCLLACGDPCDTFSPAFLHALPSLSGKCRACNAKRGAGVVFLPFVKLSRTLCQYVSFWN